MNLVREHQLCFNCLQPGHFAPQCSSYHMCQECRKPHHKLLHSQFEHDSASKTADQATKELLQNKTDDSPARHNSHLSCPHSGGQRSSELMMRCQIRVMMSDGHVTRARALLHCASSTLFATESLARRLQLSCQHQRVQVAGIGGPEHTLSSCSVVTRTVVNKKSVKVSRLSVLRWKVEATVLTKITTKLSASAVSFNRNWRHLSGLHLADPEFSVPGNIDILLGCQHVQSSST